METLVESKKCALFYCIFVFEWENIFSLCPVKTWKLSVQMHQGGIQPAADFEGHVLNLSKLLVSPRHF